MIININGEDVKLPDFLIVGAAKSGTTSLYYYLGKHYQIFMSEIKEPWFFSIVDNPPNYTSLGKPAHIKWKIEDYIELFKNVKGDLLMGEASPIYLYTYQKSIENIKRFYSKIYKKLKIVIILRDPIDRAFSQYVMFKRDNVENLSFKEAIKPDTIEQRLKDNWNVFYDYVGFGMYYNQLKAYIEEFPEVKIFLYDDLVNDQEKLLKDIYDFLNIECINIVDKEIYNKSGIPKNKFLHKLIFQQPLYLKPLKYLITKNIRSKIIHKIFELNLEKPRMDNKEKKYLNSIFEEDIKKTARLINRDLSHWLKNN